MVSVPAAQHWRKDEGFFEKKFEIFILEFMFGYILSFSRNPVKRSKLRVDLS